jgi:tRNA:m4X modification enzyme
MIDFKLLVPNDENDSKNQSNEVYIEFGAGKGLLGLSISMVRPLSTIIMVERSGMRRKADKLLRENGRNFHRFRMDIRDVSLCQLPGIDLKNISSPSDKRCMLVAKHLCGVATDFALWSFENLSKEFKNNSKGLAIATCCHHACQYHDFYGKKYISEHGFSSSEFNLMCRWSGWAHTYNNNNSSDDSSKKKDRDHPTSSAPRPPGLESSRQSDIGFKIKRIFDYCRVEALKNIGYNCELARFIIIFYFKFV